MFVRCVPSKSNIKSLYFAEGYRDECGKVKQRLVEKIGDWNDLCILYENPIAHFNEIAKTKKINDHIDLSINLNEVLPMKCNPKNLGYTLINNTLKTFQFPKIINDYQKKFKFNYSINDILKLLVFSRIISPSSKLETYNNKDMYFDNFEFSLKDLYRALDHLPSLKDDLLSSIWNNTKNTYNRDISSTYYDCTNYYFEISYNDVDLVDEFGNILEKGYRKKGPSKENKKTPIIQMGLLMDKSQIPLTYDLFAGNESEKPTLLPIIKKTKQKFNVSRTVVVADRGLNTSDNTWFLAGKNDDQTNLDGYVYGQSVRGASKKFQAWVLDQENYVIDEIVDKGNTIYFKHKSRLVSKDITLVRDDKRKNKTNMYQKQMVYYSEKYAIKQKKEREIVLTKANDLIKNPGKYNKATSYGSAKYIDNIKYDKKTGEIIVSNELVLNSKLIQEESKFDGYYSIVTSEKHLSDIEIRNIYKGLWKIEETFKITKSTLEARPVHVWTKKHIEAHFLTCFIALVILRLLEKQTDNKYSAKKIATSLGKLQCINAHHDLYQCIYTDEVISDLQSKTDLDLSKKYLKLSKIKNMIK